MTPDWLCTNVWSATDNADTGVVWLSPDWSVNSIIECDWSAKTFTIMGPITVQWLYSVTVWAQSLYSADVFLSVAIFLRRRPQFVMIVTCPDKERHCSYFSCQVNLLQCNVTTSASPDLLSLLDCHWASQRDGAGANPDPADSCVLPALRKNHWPKFCSLFTQQRILLASCFLMNKKLL